ncbi:hypothetical protein SKAU_G00382640 [Synaphobranchus kaupii]|uniref:Uncharacterized protein n=1 Tax=Synaphobranchus kaupii TaxID=118154 RepID=A0A9Q1EDX7_SYNKA|nr:hypothetical protein SKAU_G00382640 [Synaphobranchus kaupii]
MFLFSDWLGIDKWQQRKAWLTQVAHSHNRLRYWHGNHIYSQQIHYFSFRGKKECHQRIKVWRPLTKDHRPPPGSAGATPTGSPATPAGSPAATDKRPRGRPRKDAVAPPPPPTNRPKKK